MSWSASLSFYNDSQLSAPEAVRILCDKHKVTVSCRYGFSIWNCAMKCQMLNKQQLQLLKERFQAFLNGETQIVADEAFCNAVRSYYEVFLKSDRVARMVQSGGCSANDFREVFKKNIEKRVRSLPEIDGLSKETVLSSWIAKYDAIYRGEEDLCKQPNRMTLSAVSELILSKEQLYEMFQQILGIKKLEHQLLYNACQ
ncbi:hypothetical protein H8959_008178, partial [Pygathrix nigripes]